MSGLDCDRTRYDSPAGRGRRRGFTFLEIMVAMSVAFGVVGAAWAILTSSSRAGKKAQGLSAAVQAGATLLHALSADLANIRPGADLAETIFIQSDNPNLKVLKFSRQVAETPIDMGSDDHEPVDGTPVEYRAERHPVSGLFVLRRIPDEDESRSVTMREAYAEDVRFTHLYFDTCHYLRVSILLNGDTIDINQPLPKSKAADQVKPLLLSTLFRIPFRPLPPGEP